MLLSLKQLQVFFRMVLTLYDDTITELSDTTGATGAVTLMDNMNHSKSHRLLNSLPRFLHKKESLKNT